MTSFDQLSYTTHTNDASDINNPSSMQCTSHLWPTMSSKSNFFFCTGLNFFSGLISPTAQVVFITANIASIFVSLPQVTYMIFIYLQPFIFLILLTNLLSLQIEGRENEVSYKFGSTAVAKTGTGQCFTKSSNKSSTNRQLTIAVL